VFQDFMSYELTAAENIAVGDLAAGEETLVEAARRSGIHNALAALPKGYDTLLTQTFFDLADRDDPQTGVLLSGGQWQRLALARAYMRPAQIYVLDEPTAALDPRAERQLFGRFARSAGDAMALLISHRFSTVRTADRILFLGDGAIQEEGTHDELLRRGGAYAQLFQIQAAGYR
jgi:ATP-binding cassette subfamily B protein